MKRLIAALVVLGLLLIAAIVVLALNYRDEDSVAPVDAEPAARMAQLVARGAYLARAGDCQACHTARGGAPYAGGRGIVTPFGTVFTSNLTPDKRTGIGEWTPGHFWRALHNGRSRDGRLLYPAFPYTNYTRVTREDSDALFAYLSSLKPVEQPNTPHTLRFPYNTQISLAVWRALYFRPARHEVDAARSAEWNRGAYLVQSLGHCNACHASRNALGATSGTLDLSGGLILMQNWYAPALTVPGEGGVADWDAQEIVTFLKNGVTPNAWVKGPMAEVVRDSTQYMTDADLHAMATYLKAPPRNDEAQRQTEVPDPKFLARGAKLYSDHCAKCHGDEGEGVPLIYPKLAGSRAVAMDPPANLVRMVLGGGFSPSTPGNPRPYGMPPFATTLSDEDISAVVTHIRTAWGNEGAMVTARDVYVYRAGLQ